MKKLRSLKYIAEHPEEYTNVPKHNFNKPNLKAIKTKYNGYEFRSRLEATVRNKFIWKPNTVENVKEYSKFWQEVKQILTDRL